MAREPALSRAAGGLVWRSQGDQSLLALVHRPRQNDWSLPKGKLDAGETPLITALREVKEETGCSAKVICFAGVISYALREDRVKVVSYWHMAAQGNCLFTPGREVDMVRWFTVTDALRHLTRPAERALVGAQDGPPANLLSNPID